MNKLLNFSFFAVVSLLTIPAFAQGVGSLSDGSLSMGQKVETQPAPVVTPSAQTEELSSELIGDWDLQCAKSDLEPRPCRLYQLLQDQAGNAIVEINLFKLATPAGGAIAGATVIVPLETLLTGQLTLAVDGQSGKRYPFSFCNQVGCFSRIGLSEEDIAAFKAGSAAQLTVIPAVAPDQRVTVNMSLKGFTKAFDTAGPGQ